MENQIKELSLGFFQGIIVFLTKSLSLLIWIPDKACDEGKDNR